MEIIWTPQAQSDIKEIYLYIAVDDNEIAKKLVSRIENSIELLSLFEQLGVKGRYSGTRELFIARIPYFVVYAIEDKNIVILSIHHGKQKY